MWADKVQHRFDLDRIGAGLVVSTARAELESEIATGAAVVTAPPGTGKTTFVPPLVANMMLDRGAPGRVLLTQPRRVAARAAARRISVLDGSALGGPAGFTVRGERSASPDTRIEALTPGVLLRMLLADPGLDGVSAVVLDEVHERSLDGDLLLGMLREVRELRDDLTVVAMSATLDAGAVSALLGGSVVDIPSALHPLRVDYAPAATPRLDERGVTHEFLAHLARVAVDARAADNCDALVFVPGAREVDEVTRHIRALTNPAALEALPLHGGLSAREQDRAVAGRGRDEAPRIVVTTALAESSLTVPGVRLVIDSGLAREVRRDRGRDMTGLVTVSASRASAEQRAGRAARQAPGRVVRAYSETEFARMPSTSPPEIASADLTDAALTLAEWGTPAAAGLPLLTPPPAASMQQAVDTLRALELIDPAGHTTELGTRIASLPIGAREARALLAGGNALGDFALAAEITAAMSSEFRTPSADLSQLLRELRTGRTPGNERWKREAARLTRLGSANHTASRDSTDAVANPDGTVVALARPEWIARRTGPASRSYLLASGTRAALPEDSPLLIHEWIAVREVQRTIGRIADGTGAVIRLAAALSEAEALELGRTLTTSDRHSRIDAGRVRVREERRLGAIVLASSPVAPRADDAAAAFEAHLQDAGLTALDWTDEATELRGRLALLRRELGDPWPDVSDAALLEHLDEWIGADIASLSPSASLRSISVAQALRRLLPWPEAVHFDDLAPSRLAVPSGSTARVIYPPADAPDSAPVVAVKLQELFGLAETPRIAGGRVPILFHLLSPARRPLAVTDDLSSFWNGPYQEVRREMRGRYPKHPWPEDPWSAQATARTNHR